tara:strand:+ start:2034 stop:2747 length:714 start_codon:yes stop_codon:yes gene_type:complete
MGAGVEKDWPRVVLGGGLDAVRFALENEIPILFNRFPDLHSYEPLLNSDAGTLEEDWARRSYELFEKCLNPFTNLVESLRIDPEAKLITVHTKNNNLHQIRYDKLYLFDLENVFGLEEYFSRKVIRYRVLDWFDARSLGSHSSDIHLDDGFIREIRFFNSCRVDGNNNHKDIVCESLLSPEQLNDHRFSDTMARIKAADILSKLGSPAISLAFWKRDVYPIYQTIYKEVDSIFWRGT